MSLKDKLCYPAMYESQARNYNNGLVQKTYISNDGLTFREKLIIALAGNPGTISQLNTIRFNAEESAKIIIDRTDAIIKEMEKEK